MKHPMWGWNRLLRVALLLCGWSAAVQAQPSKELGNRLAHIAEKAAEAEISSYYFLGKPCSLLFIGTHHSFDPQAPLFDILDQNLDAFAPQTMIVEGGNWRELPTALEAAQQQGEMGYLTHRASKLGIPVASFELPESQLRASAVLKHAPELVKLYFLLRMVPQWRSVLGIGALDMKATQYLDKDVNPAVGPRTVEELDAMVHMLYGPNASWKLIDANLRISVANSDSLNAVDATVNGMRNISLLELIATSLQKQKRVMVTAGYTHLAALIQKLNQLESMCPK